MSIEAQGITKLYGAQKALDNVSFQINVGEVVGFLGPNGAGKSTMMKILTCFIPPNGGNAKVCGFDVQEEFQEVKKRIGYLPETNPLYSDMYVREYLDFVAGIHRLGRKSKTRIAEMIEITGLTLEQNKKITQLSKGYRQRIGLAGALMHDPEVLILDEPTSGLDPNQLEDIRLLIQKIGKQKTVMLSTHIMQEVEAVCNRVIIIDQGKIVADDSVEKLGIIGHDTVVVKVEFDRDVDTKRLMTIPGITGVNSDPGHIYHLVSKTGNDIRPEIFRFAVDNKISVLSMNIEQQRLEKIFQMLTKK